MDERLQLELNNNWWMYMNQVFLTWIVPGEVKLVINDRYMSYDWEENCFKIEGKLVHTIAIRNQLRPRTISIEGARGGWCLDSEELGKYDNLVICGNLVLAQYRNSPAGKIIACIEYNGLYTPEATCFDDEDNRFDCIKIECGGPASRIWKIR